MDREDPPHGTQGLASGCLHLRGSLIGVGIGGCVADLSDGSTQHRRQGAVHLQGVASRLGVGHDPGGHHAVLGDQIGELHPPSAVLGRVVHDGAHLFLVSVTRCRGDGASKGVVGLLELVEEGDVILRELEVVDLELVDDLGTQDVEPREFPAPSGVLLVGHLPGIQPLGGRLVDAVDHGAIQTDGVGSGAGHRILNQPPGDVVGEGLGAKGAETGIENEGFTHSSSIPVDY